MGNKHEKKEKNNGPAKRTKEDIEEKPQVIFREITQSKNQSTYNIIKISTDDKSLVEAIIKGEL